MTVELRHLPAFVVLAEELLLEEPLVAVVPADHALARRKRIRVSTLASPQRRRW
ncbi:MAG: hypothetical protein H0W70_03125 [Actinobacteria bacterium]|nr:hypothetical protein [Actinomycetota bacterium]